MKAGTEAPAFHLYEKSRILDAFSFKSPLQLSFFGIISGNDFVTKRIGTPRSNLALVRHIWSIFKGVDVATMDIFRVALEAYVEKIKSLKRKQNTVEVVEKFTEEALKAASVFWAGNQLGLVLDIPSLEQINPLFVYALRHVDLDSFRYNQYVETFGLNRPQGYAQSKIRRQELHRQQSQKTPFSVSFSFSFPFSFLFISFSNFVYFSSLFSITMVGNTQSFQKKTILKHLIDFPPTNWITAVFIS